jgi:4,5-DOPA dioxygenase extradiol
VVRNELATDVDALVGYRHKGTSAAVAHPTTDHFVPMLLTLRAGDDEASIPTTVIDREVFGDSIRSFQAA